MNTQTPVLITGGAWRGCLGVVLYQTEAQPPKYATTKISVYMVYIDRLGTVAINVDEMKELTDDVMDADDFDFVDPQVLMAQNNLHYAVMAYEDAKDRMGRAYNQLEVCKNGGVFDKTIT